MEVQQAQADGGILARGGARPNRSPVLGVGPFLVSVQVSQQGVHH
jgi:hypothetical protein